MILHREPLSIEDVEEYFPSILQSEPNFKYEVEITAFRKSNSKLIAGAHVSAINYRETDGMIMRELFPLNVTCIRVYLDKALRSDSKLLKSQLITKLVEKRDELLKAGTLYFAHPYCWAIEKLHTPTVNETILKSMQNSGHLQIIKC